METLYRKLEDILDIPEVNPTDRLREFENWDSLTVLSLIATLDASYGVNLTTDDLGKIQTVGELAALVEIQSQK